MVPTLSVCIPGRKQSKTCWTTSWYNVAHGVAQEMEDEEEWKTQSTERDREREVAHHDIFCFPTQMAMSSAVRASLSSVQVGGGEAAGELDSIGSGARMPGTGTGFRGPSRRFIVKIISLGSGACELLAADSERMGVKQVGDGAEGCCDEVRYDARSVRVGSAGCC